VNIIRDTYVVINVRVLVYKPLVLMMMKVPPPLIGNKRVPPFTPIYLIGSNKNNKSVNKGVLVMNVGAVVRLHITIPLL
jgi:hypothetical protein